MEFEFEGLDKLQKQLSELVKKYPEAVKQGMIDDGFAIQGKAKRYVAVDTGRLRASISVSWKEGDSGVEPPAESPIKKPTEDFEVRIGTNVQYAIYQELGTCKMPAHPYLRPAFEEEIQNLLKYIKQEIERG